jgi:formylglycine-generating enzyme required for sulfatase activity
MDETKADLQERITAYQRHLQVLKVQAAEYGSLHVPPYIVTQIEDDQAEIDKLQAELAELEQGKGTSTPPPRPRLSFEPETVVIPAGPFKMGRRRSEAVEPGNEPLNEVLLDAYAMGKYPVTNKQYARFVQENHGRAPQGFGWSFIKPPRKKLNDPVVGITFFDACAYCGWLSEKTGGNYRLPTETEWEKAGGDGDAGCFNMLGNIYEWTCTPWGEDWREAQEIECGNVEEPEEVEMNLGVLRVCKGGPAQGSASCLGYCTRSRFAPNSRHPSIGFRVVEAFSHKRRP